MASIRSQIENEFRFAPKLIFSDHHYCHSISALAQSGFENALSIVMDGSGERDAITVYLVRERKHKKVLSVPFPHSLGCFFAAVTQYLGFQPDSDEFKVMGLSAWGKPNQVEVFRKMMGSENVFSLDLSYFAHHKDADQFYSARFETEFGKYEDLSFQEKSDIAASAQVILNENVIRIIRTALEIAASGVDEICFSGGVFQNCILNQNIREIFPNKKLFFSPISSDLGSAVGAAFSQSYQSGEKLNFPGLYLGPSYDDQIILKYLEENRLVFRKCEDPSLEAAKLISQGHIIGWFQGSAEFGPRALGNRSILANPRVKGIKDKINKMIKQREAFRPFAPSVLYEKRQELFDCEHFAPYMIETVNTIAGKRDLVAEAIHVDGTARVQTVTNELNPHYYRLIQEFYRITGQPAVLNTSFNRNTEPIVNSPADAISCFKEAGLDFLVIGDYIVKHSDNFRI